MPGIAAAVIPAVVTGLATVGTALAMKPSGPKELPSERKKALGTFAERLAREEGAYNDPGGGYLLRPGGRPIRFNTQERPYQQRVPTRLLGQEPVKFRL